MLIKKIFRMKRILFFLASLPFFNPPISAQNQAKVESQIFNFYVLFGSECCGIDQKAFQELHAHIRQFQKKNKQKLQFETLHWGKEGERVIYFELSQLTDNQANTFFETTLQLLRNKEYKLVKVGSLLNYHLTSQTLWVHCIPYNLNQKREQDFRNYIEKFEAENQVKILQGSMINETGIEEDQDKRYELNLSTLSENLRNQLITKLKTIFAVSIHPRTRRD
jgi:hypothetical protein